MKPYLIRRSRGYAAVFNRETDKCLFSVEYSHHYKEWAVYNSPHAHMMANEFDRIAYAFAWGKTRDEAIRAGLEEVAPGLLVAQTTHSNVDA